MGDLLVNVQFQRTVKPFSAPVSRPASIGQAEKPDGGRAVLPVQSRPRDVVRFSGSTEKPLPTLSAKEQRASNALAKRYMKFLEQAVCAPLTAKTIIEEAEKHGFKEWPREGPIKARMGDKFYVNNDYESVALVVIGYDHPVESGLNIIGAHIDSPQLELKPDPLLKQGGLAKLKTKLRGGLSQLTWFNRDLGVAGRVYEPVRDKDGRPVLDPKTRLPKQEMRWIKSKSPLGIIPLEAIHHNRSLNKGREIQPEYDLSPLIGLDGQAIGVDTLKREGIDLENAESAELFLYPFEKPASVGQKGEFVAAQGHDDRSMCFAAMEGLLQAANAPRAPMKTGVAFFFDNEEVGSLDRGGARSRWVEHTIGEIIRATGKSNPTELTRNRERALSKSVILSADVAHAFDPDKAQLHDRDKPVKMGHGPVIKADTNGHYATTAKGIGLTRLLAERAGKNGVPVQTLATNQNIPCGTTIGPMIASNTNALTVDIGIPILSMHAIREVMAKNDLYYTRNLFASFFKNE